MAKTNPIEKIETKKEIGKNIEIDNIKYVPLSNLKDNFVYKQGCIGKKLLNDILKVAMASVEQKIDENGNLIPLTPEQIEINKSSGMKFMLEVQVDANILALLYKYTDENGFNEAAYKKRIATIENMKMKDVDLLRENLGDVITDFFAFMMESIPKNSQTYFRAEALPE